MDLVVCPECGDLATVSWRTNVASMAEHAKVHCLRRHWFLLPSERLVDWPDLPEASESAA